ncbi:hypothetical protein OO013_00685 [Mangrovivirga sp. M17]|uniref:Outer membrane protein beta-barrel domain-containing protein n=1 Tax=Mangrovivirga halotolerans TaxID=2993936 RepID=A0ABT3RKN4_9BACT|nr:hypothetical protein [Mangrovivirga halotolerans]MCX2742355.1 hypothetical protein [Mangrovivirga halotolerans]
MKEQDSDHTKEYWVNRLNDLEVTPPPSAWRGVKSAMDADRASKYKNTARFYRRIAASLLLLLIGLGGLGGYLFNQNSELKDEIANLSSEQTQFAVSNTEFEKQGNQINPFESSNKKNQNIEISGNDEYSPLIAGTELKESSLKNRVKDEDLKITDQSLPSKGNKDATQYFTEENSGNTFASTFVNTQDNDPKVDKFLYSQDENEQQLDFLSGRAFAYNLEVNTEDPELNGVIVLDWDKVTRLKPQSIRKPNSKRAENIWLGFNMGSGSVNQNFSQSELTLAELMEEEIEPMVLTETSGFNTDAIPGPSYVAGLELGGKLTDRVVLQGGLNYLYQEAISSSNVAFSRDLNSVSETLNITNIRDLKEQRNTTELSYIPDTELTTAYEYLSFPLEAGYILLDKRFSITGNAGVITDVFMAGKVTARHGLYEVTRFGNDGESPYNSFNFRASGALMLSYDLKSNLRLLLKPQYTHAISSYTKVGTSLNSNPYSLMLSAGLKYKFK